MTGKYQTTNSIKKRKRSCCRDRKSEAYNNDWDRLLFLYGNFQGKFLRSPNVYCLTAFRQSRMPQICSSSSGRQTEPQPQPPVLTCQTFFKEIPASPVELGIDQHYVLYENETATSQNNTGSQRSPQSLSLALLLIDRSSTNYYTILLLLQLLPLHFQQPKHGKGNLCAGWGVCAWSESRAPTGGIAPTY